MEKTNQELWEKRQAELKNHLDNGAKFDFIKELKPVIKSLKEGKTIEVIDLLEKEEK